MGPQRTTRRGASHGVVHFSGSRQPLQLSNKALPAHRANTVRRVEEQIAAIDKETAVQVRRMQEDQGPDADQDIPVLDGGERQDEWEDELERPLLSDPVLAEGFVEALKDITNSRWKKRWYKDHRTWKQRRTAVFDRWQALFVPMTQAYINFTSNRSPPLQNDAQTPFDSDYDFDISVLDIYSLSDNVNIPRNEESVTAVSLVDAGYIGNTPEAPSVAVSLKTLELYRALRLFRPSFSVEAFAKLLCYRYQRPYRRHYRSIISDTFDVYLELRRRVDAKVQRLLGRDGENYRVLHSCPPCTYEVRGSITELQYPDTYPMTQLNDEPELRWRRMIAIDGNNSLKRIKGIGSRDVADTRTFDSDYFLPTTYVDQYADEVPSRPPKRQQLNRTQGNEDGEESSNETPADGSLSFGGDPTDGGDGGVIPCADNWKAAASEEKKKMWGIFSEAGIFAGACRHGFILWVADMVCSGELAKYPLAVVAKSLEVLGPQILIGYDIGCSFGGTVLRSSLGPRFQDSGYRCCVDSFHGYAHEYSCQLNHHPNAILGAGLEDFATMERIFSAFNSLASITRYMSAFHRRAFIDMYFNHWDDEKYQNLGTMLLNNYRQALDIIEENTLSIQQTLASYHITEEDLQGYIKHERQYFHSLDKGSDKDIHTMSYVRLLERLQETEYRYNATSSHFRTETPADYQALSTDSQYGHALSVTRKLETERNDLYDQMTKLRTEILLLEGAMNITSCWTPSSTEYIRTLKLIAEQKYRSALEDLYWLVVKRLFELHKMNLSQTGYKMRTQISRNLQVRSKTIRRTVQRYNKAAQSIGRPPLDWAKVSHYSFLDEFHILRDTRSSGNVSDQAWANPVIRETMRQYQRRERAQEEIERLNIELRRLHTAILDEECSFKGILSQLREEAHPLVGEVSTFIRRRRGVNQLLLSRIFQVHELPGFTGLRMAGVQKGCVAIDSVLKRTCNQSSEDLVSTPSRTEDGESDAESDVDDAVEGDIGGLCDYLSIDL